MNKALQFYLLYVSRDWKGLTKLLCESIEGTARGDALYEKIWPIVQEHTK